PSDLAQYRNSRSVPPATQRVTSQIGALTAPTTEEISVAWSSDGEAVSIIIRATVFAFLIAGDPRGFCRFLVIGSPFGQPFDTARFETLFSVKN
ncbi:MAG: hypothetical protein WBD51_09070, partial [Burkholderiaceae bacterium]